MKYLLLILFPLMLGSANAQTYAPFPLDETAQWQQDYGWVDGAGCVYQHEILCFVDGDTVLDGMTYTRISYYGYQWGQTAFGGAICNTPPAYFTGLTGLFRVDSGKYYVRNYYDGPEELLYDFTLNAGDTLNTIITESPMIVDSVDFIDIDGLTCKRLWLSNINDYTFEESWILEGVGSQNGLNVHFYEFENWNNLECYSHSGLSVIGPYDPYPCLLINDVQRVESQDISIFPNPTNNLLHITGLTKSTKFTISNILGNIVLSGSTTDQKDIDISNLPDGIYLVQLQLNGELRSVKVIKAN